MNKLTHLLPFLQTLFDGPHVARKAARIVTAILEGRSPRLSDITREMQGNEAANGSLRVMARESRFLPSQIKLFCSRLGITESGQRDM